MSLSKSALREIGVIRDFKIWRLSIPLNRPYYTSNNPKGRAALDVLLIRATTSEGRTGWGEACPSLSGYSPETPQTGWTFLKEALPTLLGQFNDEKWGAIRSQLHKFPFVISGVSECFSELIRDPLLEPPTSSVDFELAGTVNTLDRDEAGKLALDYVNAGYRTLKVKVGMNPKDDAARVIRIYEAVNGRARQRVDANRHYQPDAALEFSKSVPVEAIEYFEQPFGQQGWSEMEELSKKSPLPLMLDESIYGIEDIKRVATSGCAKAVKLKMSKVGGPSALIEQINFAGALGLDVVVGNGVATDFGCYREALCCARADLKTAGEMNGFLKLTTRILNIPLEMHGSHLHIEKYCQPTISEEKLAEVAQDEILVS